MKYAKYRINMIDNNSFTEKDNALCNLGESNQELAMDKIFLDIGIDESDVIYIKRDENFEKNIYNENITMPVHIGLVNENKHRLPLPTNFKPIFISVCIYNDFFDKSPETLEYFKKNEPIGCRDEYTKDLLLKYGVKAYLMGCFTVCFNQRTIKPDDGKVFIIDIPEEANDCIPETIKKDAVYLQNSIPFDVYPVTEEEDINKKEIANKRLELYKREAKLVITGRLHVVIPCMAMGIPVIMIRNNYDTRFGWIDKYLPLYTLDDLHDINWNPMAIDLSFARKKIIEYLRKSLYGITNAENELVELDEFYCNRNRTVLNKKIYDAVNKAVVSIGCDDFTYAIWGAGTHCHFVYDVITKLYPNAKLVLVVDKFVKGERYGVTIVNGEQVDKINFDHMFITTLPGKNEAINKMKELLGENARKKYSVITTFVRS